MPVNERRFQYCPRCGRKIDHEHFGTHYRECLPADSGSTPALSEELRAINLKKVYKRPYGLLGIVERRRRRRRRLVYLTRFSLLCFVIFFMIGTGVLWVLSLVGIVATYWAAVFTAVFTVLGVLLSFVTWFFPRSSN